MSGRLEVGRKHTLAGGLGGGIGSLHARQGLSYPLEKALDVVAELGARFHEHQVVLLGLILALLGRDLALVVQVGLVAHQHNDNIVASLGPDIIDPLLGVME